MYCHICGHKLSDEDIFCSKCGAKVKKQEDYVPVEEKPEDTYIPEEAAPHEPQAGYFGEYEGKDEAEEKCDTVPEDKTDINPTETDKKPVSEEMTFDFKPKEYVPENEIFKPIPDLIFADSDDNINKNEKAPKKKGSGKVQAVCSVLLSLFIFVFVVVLVMQLFVRFGFTEERLDEAFNNVNYKEIKASSIFDLKAISDKYGKEIPEDATLSEAIYKVIDQKELINPISKKEVDRLVERLTANQNIQKFMAQKSSKAVNLLRTGSREQPVYASDVIEFLKDNESDIETTIGIDILDVDYDYMQKYLEDNNEEFLDVLSEKNVTGTDNSLLYTMIRFFCSDIFIGVLGVLIIGISIAIGFINRRVSSSFLYTGVPFTVAGLILLATGIFYKYILFKLSGYFPTDFIAQFSSPVISILTIISAAVVALGAILIVTGVVTKVIRNRKRIINLNTVA